jgi:hypothetical protein
MVLFELGHFFKRRKTILMVENDMKMEDLDIFPLVRMNYYEETACRGFSNCVDTQRRKTRFWEAPAEPFRK